MCRNLSIDLQCKLMDWFLCDRDQRHVTVNGCSPYIETSQYTVKGLMGVDFEVKWRKYTRTSFI